MSGAVIEEGAIIARSVVGPGVRIRKDHRIIDGISAGIRPQDIHEHGIAPSAEGSGRLGENRLSPQIRSTQL